MCEAMAYKVGYRTVKPTLKEIRGVTKFLTKNHMMVITKVTNGMVITIAKKKASLIGVRKACSGWVTIMSWPSGREARSGAASC